MYQYHQLKAIQFRIPLVCYFLHIPQRQGVMHKLEYLFCFSSQVFPVKIALLQIIRLWVPLYLLPGMWSFQFSWWMIHFCISAILSSWFLLLHQILSLIRFLNSRVLGIIVKVTYWGGCLEQGEWWKQVRSHDYLGMQHLRSSISLVPQGGFNTNFSHFGRKKELLTGISQLLGIDCLDK